MSSRALRKKLQESSDIGLGPAPEEEDHEEEVTVARGAVPKRTVNLNPFDLLNADSCSESEIKEDDDLGTESSRSRAELQASKNKSRKKKGNRKRGKNVPKSSEDNLEEFEDEVERSVHEVNQLLGEVARPPAPESINGSTKSSLLCVQQKHLNPENEMKKMFGARVIHAESNRHRKGRTRASHIKSHWLVVPKPNWPNPGKTGLSMRFLDSDKEGNQYFTFEHSQQYQQIQKTFFDAVESMNPDFIVQLLNQHPFHIDSMLQLSEICKMGEDLQMATELIERTLFSMESAFHPLFNLAVGSSRLDYKRQENRAFFIALFRHIAYIGSRACHRTALEFCKLLLSLDMSDPLGALLMIDFYAIRAQQFAWLIKFFDEFEQSRNLSQLPNFAYSIALAHFYRKDEDHATDGDVTKADDFIQKALIMFPGMLLPILDKCSIEPDKKVASHSFFVDSQIGQPTGLKVLSNLYISRAFHAWKDPDLLPWLERNCRVVLDRVDRKDPFVLECAEKRKVRYQGAPRAIYRHVIMADFKEATTSLPRELSELPVMSYDPLPPEDSIDIYGKSKMSAADAGSDRGAFSLFFRSMLPNFDPNDPNASARTEGAVADAASAAGQGDLRRSVTTLLDAMQDLLGNLHLPEVPNDADVSEESEDDADEWR